ncbi:sequence orphan [Pseudozyma hubeiensis SY62]|uniref:Sequence orphan n=1 Tax=Pseudozyma hubeiensis (strain SY62) TaxID=1305764 RepID=R9PGJ4_PSEHS|nr:sequence orphan [Pseudozyma hubeiensis SY62]GAC97225.1 sequence orphan [Pseudozyma hubeiensis SY62]
MRVAMDTLATWQHSQMNDRGRRGIYCTLLTPAPDVCITGVRRQRMWRVSQCFGPRCVAQLDLGARVAAAKIEIKTCKIAICEESSNTQAQTGRSDELCGMPARFLAERNSCQHRSSDEVGSHGNVIQNRDPHETNLGRLLHSQHQ